ncbi:hypothetical protein PPYR_09172 [Photinus pyralis]|uniref:Uncharacterized protein n=1 Tax=Photinus pyralis TaxID=7054 RepID=A0A5N4ALH9_PHOPY|nr:uncharacterized protein LOC116172441 [Photinus pyralis]KAB0798179.1 hypothetical protein PPYR_09172 [Photinus pyralis]
MKPSVFHSKTMIVLASVVIVLCSLSTSEAQKKVPAEVVAKWNELVMPYHKLCLNETHDKPEPIIHMLADYTIPDEKSIHCYWKCFHEHAKFLSNGKFDIDVMLKLVYSLPRELAEKCIVQGEAESDICQKSYTLVQCIVMAEVV